MPLIAQQVKGNYRSNNIVASEADVTTITGMMEGIIETYDEKASGGTDVVTPASFNMIKIAVSRPTDKLSCTFTLKHVKASKNSKDLFADKALFDANFDSTLAAQNIRTLYNRN